MSETLKHTLRISISCTLAYSLSSLLPLAAGYWALITVIATLNPAFDQTLEAGRNQIIGTLLGGIVGTAVIYGTVHGFKTGPLFIAGFIPLALITGKWPSLRMSCTTLVILVLIPTIGSPYLRAFTRFVEIFIGVVCAVSVTRVLELLDKKLTSQSSESL